MISSVEIQRDGAIEDTGLSDWIRVAPGAHTHTLSDHTVSVRITRLYGEQLSKVLFSWLLQELFRGDWRNKLNWQVSVYWLTQYVDPTP